MHNAEILLELGAVIIGLAVLARVAGRLGLPAIPLYLLAGLAFGKGGVLPLVTTSDFIEIGAQLGLILLLFMLGLEYSAKQLVETLRSSTRLALFDVVANFVPGVLFGLLLGWSFLASLFLGGVCYATSSGIVAKLIHDSGDAGSPEARVSLSVLVIEDLTMAVYLPVMGGLLFGGVSTKGLASVAFAVAFVAVVLFLALRFEVGMSRMLFSNSDETLVLTILGIALIVAGLAESLQVSAAVGALLVGIALSGPAASGARSLLSPLRDLFAAFFFAFFGLSVDPGSLTSSIGPALLLAGITGTTKFFTGYMGARWAGLSKRARRRVGFGLVARGEFSIAIATLALSGGVESDLGPLAAAYVISLAVFGPLAVKVDEVIESRRQRPEGETLVS